ncbi:thiamine diphosphokinase [Chloroflexota bacterium]
MRTIIIANGSLNQNIEISGDDLVIAANGGAKHCLQLGLVPDFVVGDLDSLSKKDLDILITEGVKTIHYPTRKEYTDLELALQKANDIGSSEVLIYGALGARWDQTFANILLPPIFPSLRIRIIDGPQELRILRGGEEINLSGKSGDIISLIPLTNSVIGITTKGLEYKLENEDLQFGHTRGVSNVLNGESATIKSEEGLLLCVMIRR